MRTYLKILILLVSCIGFVGCSTGLSGLNYSSGDSVIDGGGDGGGDTEEVGVEGSIATKTLSGSVVVPQVEGDQRLANVSNKSLVSFATSACSSCEVEIRNYETEELIETVYTESDGTYSVEVEEDLLKDPNDDSMIKIKIVAKIKDGLEFSNYFEESLGDSEAVQIGRTSIDDHFGYIFAHKGSVVNMKCQNKFTEQMFLKSDRDAEVEISGNSGPAIVYGGSISSKEALVNEDVEGGSVFTDALNSNVSDSVGIFMAWFECLIANDISASSFGYEDYNDLIDALTNTDFNIRDIGIATFDEGSGSCLPDDEDLATANTYIILTVARDILDTVTDVAKAHVVNDENICSEDLEVEQMAAMVSGFKGINIDKDFDDEYVPGLKAVIEKQRDVGKYMTDVDVVEIIPAYLETSRTPITSMSDQEFETFISLTTGGGDYYEAVSKSEKYIYATALVALSQSECLAEDPEKLAEVESNPELYSQAYLNDMDVLVASIGGLDDLADNFCYSKSEVIEECKDELTEYYDAEGAFITADGPDVFDSLDVCGNEVPQGLMYDADSSCGDGVCNIANEENSKSCAADCLYSGSKCVNEADNKLIGAIEIDNEVYGDELVENKAKINCLGDLEYYKMLVDDGETLSVKVTVYDDDNSQSLDRAIVYITDSSNELLTASASYDIYDSACVSVTNNSGQNGVAYHAIVHGLGDSFTGTYTIEVSTTLNCDDMFGGIVVQ